ncbi:MAG: hypothetical protein WDN31_12990 [Hyphomicrobium sp.]
MSARRYLAENLSPEELRLAEGVLKEAWEGLRVDGGHVDVDSSRLRLAGIVIVLIKRCTFDHVTLVDLAVSLMKRPHA